MVVVSLVALGVAVGLSVATRHLGLAWYGAALAALGLLAAYGVGVGPLAIGLVVVVVGLAKGRASRVE